MVNVDFIPLVKEQYDLVVMKSEQNSKLIKSLLEILNSDDFKKKSILLKAMMFQKRAQSVLKQINS